MLLGTWYRSHEKYVTAFTACCIIHNICIDHRDTVSAADVEAAIQVTRRQRAQRQAQVGPVVIAAPAAAGTFAAGRVVRNTLLRRNTGIQLSAQWIV
jgi:hypothetical protein